MEDQTGDERITLRLIWRKWCSWFMTVLSVSVQPPCSATNEVGRMAEVWVVASCLTGGMCRICIEHCRWKIRCPLEWILCDVYRV